MIYGVLVMLGYLVVQRPLEVPTQVALGYTKNSEPFWESSGICLPSPSLQQVLVAHPGEPGLSSSPQKTMTKPSAKQITHCSVSVILLASLCSLECPLHSPKSYSYKGPSTSPNFSGKPSKIFLAHRNYAFLRILGCATIFFLDSSYSMVLFVSICLWYF